MSRKLPVVRARELIRAATKAGFVFDRQKGSHAVYFREKDGARIVIPVHAGKTIKLKTVTTCITQRPNSNKIFNIS